MKDLTFITLVAPGITVLDALMMAESIRNFGDELSKCDIFLLVPDELNSFTEEELAEFSRLNLQLIPIPVDSEVLKFPFAAKVIAAAYVENITKGRTEYLVWLDHDNIILRQPDEFLLLPEKKLGFRPVHHKLIGSGWDEPISPFWELVFKCCDVPKDRLFQMTTHTGEKIKPYFNVGTFVVRPEIGVLTQWQDAFMMYYRQPEFRNFYERHQLYSIFIHQAIWTGVLLHAITPDEMQLLSPNINYPLHLHNDIPENLRAKTVNELTTLRHENIFDSPEWQSILPITEPLRSWLKSQLRVQNRSTID